MDFKKETKKELDFLKSLGYTQAEIAEKIGYRETGITESQAKGGSEKLYKSVLLFKEWIILKKVISEDVQVSEKDSKSGVQGVNSDPAGKSFASSLKSVAEAQQVLADRLKSLSAAVESVSSEELDKLFQVILDSGKNSNVKKGKPGK